MEEKLKELKEKQKSLRANLRQADILGNYGVFGESWGRLSGETQDSIRQKLRLVNAKIEIIESIK